MGRGFTLLEVMISMSVLAMVVVTLMGTQTAALRLAGQHRNRTLVTDLARAQLAEALLIPADELGPAQGEGDGAYRAYRWERTVRPTGTDGLYRVRVTVTSEMGGEYALETLVTATEVDL